MKNKNFIYVSIFIFMFLLSLTKVKAYTPDFNISGKDPYYDITDVNINNDKLTISGWGIVKDKDNGRFSVASGKVDYSPMYTIYIKDKEGHVVAEGSYYNETMLDNPFSLTCILFTDNDGSGTASNNGQDCMNYMPSKNFNARNAMIEKASNQSPYRNNYYDGVDFKIEIPDISQKLKHSTEYHLELKMKLGGYESNTVPVFVYHDRISYDPEVTKFDHYNESHFVKITAQLAKMQQQEFSYVRANAIGSSCYFVYNGQYAYDDKIPEPAISSTNTKYYYYKLKMGKGAYEGSCGNITSSNIYKNNPADYKVWSHAGWLQPSGDTSFTLIMRNPCVYGTQTETATEYAINHPGICCDEVKETCCGNKPYMENLYKTDPTNYLFSTSYCCNPNGTYKIDNHEPYIGKTFYSFYHYLDNELESYKDDYWRAIDSTRFYPQNTLVNICKNSEWAGKACPEGTTKDEDSQILSMQYVTSGETSLTHDVEVLLKSKNASVDNVGMGYFTDSDYEQYLKIAKNSEFKNISYKENALTNKHFRITVNKVTKMSSVATNGKYKYKINFTINITSLNGAKMSSRGYYFIPVKIWYCKGNDEKECPDGTCDPTTTPPPTTTPGKTCNDSDYFSRHKYDCCKENMNKPGCKCTSSSDGECFTWLDSSDCNKTSNANYNVGTKKTTLTDGEETITETVTFDEFPTLELMKHSAFKAGTGFEYTIGTVTHKITTERHYLSAYGGTTLDCYYSGCISDEKENVDSFYSSVNRNTTNDINQIKNLTYNFNGIVKNEDYDLTMIDDTGTRTIEKNSDGTNMQDKIKICYNYPDTSADGWGESCSTYNYDSKVTYTYKYNLTLKNKYIDKLQNKDEEDLNITTTKPSSSEMLNYLDGGNKFYTLLSQKNGIYGIEIKLKSSKGLTGTLDENEKFTCQYEVTDGYKNSDKYYFRQISLNTPFPNQRVIGNNWNPYCTNGQNCTYITTDETNSEKKDKVYSQTPMYRATLSPALITEIKKYNKSVNGNYGWVNMTNYPNENTDSTSNFLNTTGTVIFQWDNNLTINNNLNRTEKIGDFE